MKRQSLHSTNLQRNQSGMVSIMVTMILMIVMSLIVVGFAQVSRRNQRVALDRQLSTQAFYAAESGVNDAREFLKGVANPAGVPAKTGCNDNVGGYYAALPNRTLSTGVSYSCLLINPTPTVLQYNNIGEQSTIIPLISATGNAINTLTLEWQAKNASTTPVANCPTAIKNQFTPSANWDCEYGVLRFDLVNVEGNKTIANYQSTTMTSFVVPVKSGSTSTTFSAGNNALIGTACTNTSCKLTITGGLGGTQYYMRVSSVYKESTLNVSAAGAGGSIRLAGAQVIIDSTGKAQDVLRRIQVHMPLNSISSNNQLPDNAIQSTDTICKRFSIMDGWSDNSPDGVSGINDLCN